MIKCVAHGGVSWLNVGGQTPIIGSDGICGNGAISLLSAIFPSFITSSEPLRYGLPQCLIPVSVRTNIIYMYMALTGDPG